MRTRRDRLGYIYIYIYLSPKPPLLATVPGSKTGLRRGRTRGDGRKRASRRRGDPKVRDTIECVGKRMFKLYDAIYDVFVCGVVVVYGR